MKNPTDILIDATKFPAAIEAKLPAGAPKLSETLADIASKLPKVPDLPIDIPAPPVPELPELPAMPGPPELRRYVTGVEVAPVVGAAAVVPPVTPPPARKALVPLVFE